MKNILLICALFLSITGFAQTRTVQADNINAVNAFGVPIRDTTGTKFKNGELRVRPQDTLMYRHNGRTVGRKWDLVLDTRTVTTFTFVPTTRTLTIQGVTQDLSEDRTWNPVDTVSILVTQSDLPALVAALQVGISNAGDGNGGDSLVKVLSESELLVKRLKEGTNIDIENVGDTILQISATAASAQGTPIIITDADYTIAAGVGYVVVDGLTANRTVTLPSAASNSGRIITIKHSGYSAFDVLLSPAVTVYSGGGGATVTELNPTEHITIFSNGSIWQVVERN